MTTGPARLLDDLNDAQRVAVQAAPVPLAILAGAGSGKTRVISRRAAYAIETGVVPEQNVLLVTFTNKAADEMVQRMASLGHPRVMARTFHAMALAQLRHFWPELHDGAPLPTLTPGKGALLHPLAQRLPTPYKFTPLKDLASAIEWAKVRRISPDRWMAEGGDHAPIPADLFARTYRQYEQAKARAGVIDFEDVLVHTVEMLEANEEILATVRARKTWISVDEYQDTNPLCERLLELWLGASPALTVVGDPNQTIFTFTGATPDYLLQFTARHPGSQRVRLTENYRSTPQVLELANRLIGAEPAAALRSTQPAGPVPAIRRFGSAEEELDGIVDGIRGLIAAGTPPQEIGVLMRVNAALTPLEPLLTRAGIPFTLRGERFFARREIVEARARIRKLKSSLRGDALLAELRRLLEGLGLQEDDEGAPPEAAGGATVGEEARERSASLETLLGIAEDLGRQQPDLDAAALLAELARREEIEAAGDDEGVSLLTYHRAKGLEWDAVFLPCLEEGTLPIRQAETAEEIDEERRLLYVGITRARRHLALSWAGMRMGRSRPTPRHPSSFLDDISPRTTSGRAKGSGGGAPRTRVTELPPQGVLNRRAASVAGSPLLESLRAWRRRRATEDDVPAYVIAHDTTLEAIAEERPGSMAELRRCRGMGPARLERYGEEILDVVRGS